MVTPKLVAVKCLLKERLDNVSRVNVMAHETVDLCNGSSLSCLRSGCVV